MLKKKNRLSRREFAYLLKHGRRIHGEHMTLVYVAGIKDDRQKTIGDEKQTTGSVCNTTTAYHLPPTTPVRAGVVVSKKTARKAVDRNRIRRLVYHVLGETLDLARPLYLAVMTRPSITTRTDEELRGELAGLLGVTAQHACHSRAEPAPEPPSEAGI